MISEYPLLNPAFDSTLYLVYFVDEGGLAHINHIFLQFGCKDSNLDFIQFIIYL
jgi:hypothetical protein